MEIDVFNEVVTSKSTRVFIRSDHHLKDIAGPYSKAGKTLPAYFPLHLTADGSYTATVLDPAVWTPDTPVYYRIRDKDNNVVSIAGIRKIGVTGRNIFLNGRRTVFRAVAADSAVHGLARERLSLIVKEMDPQLVETATYLGIPIILDLSRANETAVEGITRQCSWPAVHCAIVSKDDHSAIKNIKNANLLHMVRLDRWPNEDFPDWAHGAVVPAEQLRSAEERPEFPVFAESAGASVDLNDAASLRKACERLQCELAPKHDLAGYLIRL